jgi:hypothetical protein
MKNYHFILSAILEKGLRVLLDYLLEWNGIESTREKREPLKHRDIADHHEKFPDI